MSTDIQMPAAPAVTAQDRAAQADVLSALRASSTLVALKLTAWHAGKTDRGAGEEVEQSNNAAAGAVKVIKNRLAGADARLRAIHAHDAGVREAHRILTRPWHRTGTADEGGHRLLPNVAFFDYMKRMNALNAQRGQLVQALVDNWDADVASAVANLGSLANPADYPTSTQIAGFFTMRLEYQPLPDAGGYSALPGSAATLLSTALAKRAEDHMRNAVQATFTEARKTAERLIHVLGAEKPRIHEPLLDDARAILPTLQGFASVARACGLGGDADRMDELHDLLSGAVSGIDTKTLRKSEAAKKDLADTAREMTGKLAAWGV